VDPVSHVIFSQTLVTAVGRQPATSRLRAAAAVLGALAPDSDAVAMPFGWDLYLRAHEVGTHTIAGSLVLACLIAALLKLLANVKRSGVRRSPSARFIDLLWPAWLGCLSHVILDIVSGAQIRIAWPLPGGHVSLPLVAMADPWLIAVFTAGAITLAVARSQRRRAAVAVIAIVAMFLGGKGVQLARALPTLADAMTGTPAITRVIEARWGSLTEWYAFERHAEVLQQWQIGAGAAPRLLLAWPVLSESALSERSRSLATVQNFLAVHGLGFAVEVPQGDSGTRVLWSDIRFCWHPGVDADADPSLQPVPTMNTAEGETRIACGLWFGGAFDGEGRPLRQLVKVGGWWQERALAR
jgi:membrane-bound metal-dependent hydrolase YbcI (DUF457 family)